MSRQLVLKQLFAIAIVMLLTVVCTIPGSAPVAELPPATSTPEQHAGVPAQPAVVATTSTTAAARSTFTPTSPSEAPVVLGPQYGSIAIVGNTTFIEWTQSALALLEAEAPDAYAKIETYVGVIEQSDRSGMWAYEDPPRYEVSDETAFYSLTWYASTIAHDATHSELYHQYLESYGAPVPDDIWTSVAAEQFCISYQLDVLIRIGGPAGEVDYLGTQTGDHCDIDGDGDCDWDDYYGRDW